MRSARRPMVPVRAPARGRPAPALRRRRRPSSESRDDGSLPGPWSSLLLCDSRDRAPDSLIRRASADVAPHRLVDLLPCGTWVSGEKRRGLHDLAGLAVSALRNLLGDPRLLHGMT